MEGAGRAASRVVVIGGHGNFGARICRSLAADAGIEVIATGRRHRDAGPRVRSAVLDVDAADFEAGLRAARPRSRRCCPTRESLSNG